MTMPSVKKAVIPAAGLGTRFLPATKAQPKEMLPVVDKPAIQYVVEEAVRAGIDDILIITGRGKRTLEDHFDRSIELEAELHSKGKDELLDEVLRLADLADIHYVRQGEALGLGHAVAMARKHVGDEPFAVMLGDDIMDERSTVLTEMIDLHDERGGSVIALKEFPREEISAYGCVDPGEIDGRVVEIRGLVEKPPPEEAPSTWRSWAATSSARRSSTPSTT
jgi:UTP--glucose-1-phosphate uridylyltransferase